MGKTSRGNYVFVTWKGNHSPHHVHVYRDGNLIVKWDIDHWRPMKGQAGKKILKLISDLLQEGEI
jgi:hypothetical protein